MKNILQYDLPLKDLRIESDTINSMDNIEFAGPIVVVDNTDSLEYAIKRLKNSNLIGFDTESRPAFLKGQKFPVSIIQFSLFDEAFIFCLKKTGLVPEVIDLLSSKDILKVGVGVSDDIKRLNEMSSFAHDGFVDLSDMAKKKGLIQSGARALTARYLGKKLVKSSQKTNWARSDLSERQLRYAATDAWVCLHILKYLENDKTDYFKLRAEEVACQDEEA